MKAARLRQYSILRPIFRVRDWIMSRMGLFVLKKHVKYYLFKMRIQKEDYQKKQLINREIYTLPTGHFRHSHPKSEFVISLTSYGKRVESSLPYTLYSLLKQSVLPRDIAVFLDEEQWNDSKLPPILKKLQDCGVSFYYCEDVKSFTKLLPALKQFPDDPIITVDDDVYYHPQMVEWMKEAYSNSDKKTVLGQWGCVPEKCDGAYIPYNSWKDCKDADADAPISIYGAAGCCYPPHIFDNEIFRKDIFLSLCPYADDIWFWAMEERQSIKRGYIVPKGYGYHDSVDRILDYEVGKDGCLTLTNVINGANNQQLRNVVDYYHLEK